MSIQSRCKQGDASVVMATVATDCTGRARSIVQNAQRIDNSARFHDSLAHSLTRGPRKPIRAADQATGVERASQKQAQIFFPGGTCCDAGRESDSAAVLVGNIYEPHFAIWQQGGQPPRRRCRVTAFVFKKNRNSAGLRRSRYCK